MRILIVEDEPKIATALRQGLEAEAYFVSAANNGEEGFFLASSEHFDLIILDVMLPRRSGIEILSASPSLPPVGGKIPFSPIVKHLRATYYV